MGFNSVFKGLILGSHAPLLKRALANFFFVSQTRVNLRSTVFISRKNSTFEAEDSTCWMVVSKSSSSLWCFCCKLYRFRRSASKSSWWMKRLQSPVYYCHQISKLNYIVRELGSQYLFHKCASIWSKNINRE